MEEIDFILLGVAIGFMVISNILFVSGFKSIAAVSAGVASLATGFVSIFLFDLTFEAFDTDFDGLDFIAILLMGVLIAALVVALVATCSAVVAGLAARNRTKTYTVSSVVFYLFTLVPTVVLYVNI